MAFNNTPANKIEGAFERLKALGEWEQHIRISTLTDRVPNKDRPGVGGFDAGIACSLDLIPRDKQKLAAVLHAGYTPAAINQIKKEFQEEDNESETTWWAAACSTCKEGPSTAKSFADQINEFENLVERPEERLNAAQKEIEGMLNNFTVKDGVAFSNADGGVIGAYLSGHEYGVSFSPSYGIWFVSTYTKTLGLPENFDWENDPTQPHSNSGPVHGSLQYVKASTSYELQKILGSIQLESSI